MVPSLRQSGVNRRIGESTAAARGSRGGRFGCNLPWLLFHSVAAAQRLPQVSLNAQYVLMCVAITQLLAGAAALLGKAIGRESKGLTLAARSFLLLAPVSADTDINPKVYHILFLLMVGWTIITACIIAYISHSSRSSSVARYEASQQ